MKHLTDYQFSCNGYMVSELGNTKIKLYKEHNCYHLIHWNILGAGKVWEVFKTHGEAKRQFRKLRIIQKGNYTMKHYEIKP